MAHYASLKLDSGDLYDPIGALGHDALDVLDCNHGMSLGDEDGFCWLYLDEHETPELALADAECKVPAIEKATGYRVVKIDVEETSGEDHHADCDVCNCDHDDAVETSPGQFDCGECGGGYATGSFMAAVCTGGEA